MPLAHSRGPKKRLVPDRRLATPDASNKLLEIWQDFKENDQEKDDAHV
jgi:hypothetical protein